MNKREAKIAALDSAYRLCCNTDHGMFFEMDMPFEDQVKILNALHDLGHSLKFRSDKLANKPVEPTADISRHCSCTNGWNKYCIIHGHG